MMSMVIWLNRESIEECDGCVLKGQCAGFFESNRQAHSSHIKKVEHISSDISC